MNRRDRAHWRSAQTLDDLGELVIAWLHGEIRTTPGHDGPVWDETLTWIPALTVANRAGFITDNSSPAADAWGDPSEASVSGFMTDEALARWEKITAPPSHADGLVMAKCRQGHHECGKAKPWQLWCPGREARGWWSRACPDVGRQLAGTWYVDIGDPVAGWNLRLLTALEGLAQ